ncbi:MAG TPA: two-component regulator propeller domain-containing protein, partial [Candidatus Saccharimonadales bacterium]|nr:two-component regulator propeller domain-containing protein [Candidatus Saccharimonadales bacterium]
MGTFAAVALPIGLRAATSPEGSTYAVSHWGMEDGLPLNKVRAIAQTPDGYLWVGTFNGLARFDGVHFEVFDAANTPALASDQIESLCVDRRGRLWVGGNLGQLTVRANGVFSSIPVPAGWSDRPLLRLMAAGDGTVWAMNEEGCMLALRDGRPPRVVRTHSMPNLFATDLQGTAWIVQEGRLFQLDSDRGAIPASGSPHLVAPKAMFAAREGGVWIVDENRLRRWQEGRWVEDRGAADWGTIVLAAFIETRSLRIVAGSFKEGLHVLHRDGRMEHLDEASGFLDNWAYCIFQDREGNVWVGTGNDGLVSLHPRRVTMVDAPDHWQSSAVLSASPSHAGGIWIGTEGGGIYRLNHGVVSNLSASAGIWQAVANSVLEDHTGRLWVGTWSSGLRYLEAGGFKPAYPPVSGRNVVFTIFEARNGDMWVGTRGGPGCRSNGKWNWFDNVPALHGAAVRCFAEDDDGAIWCGLDGGGVCRLLGGTVTTFRTAQGLASDYVRTIVADHDKAVWIGTRSGVSRYKDGRFSTLTPRQGLPSDVICQMLDDGAGNFWIGSFGGIVRVTKSDLNRVADGSSPAVKCLV